MDFLSIKPGTGPWKFPLLLGLLAVGLNAQIPALAWFQQWNNASGGIVIQDMQTNTQGDVYMVGSFTGSIDFDPGIPTNVLTASGTDGFILRLDASGQFKWAGLITGGVGSEFCRKITFDLQSNAYILGNSSAGTDLNPGTGVQVGTAGDFIIKLDPQNQLVWGGCVGSGGGSGCISVDNGFLYCTGDFVNTCDLDPGPSSQSFTCSTGGSFPDFYILKLSLSGVFQWAVTPKASNGSELIAGLAFDQAGNIYIHGRFTDMCDFNPSTTVTALTCTVFIDTYVAKYSPNGSLVWVNQFNKLSTLAISTDILFRNNLLYLTANFNAPLDFDLVGSSATLTPFGSNDIACAAYDANGSFQWVRQIGGSGDDRSYQIRKGISGKFYIVGIFTSPADFDPGSASVVLTPVSNNDLFFLSLDATGGFDAVSSIASALSSSLSVLSSRIRLFCDTNGDVFLSGLFSQITDFDLSVTSYTAAPTGSIDAFLVKYALCPSAPLNLNPQPLQSICAGKSTSLAATTTANVSWFATQTSTSVLATGSLILTPTLAAGTYSWYAAANTCSLNESRKVFVVQVSPTPTVAIASSAATVCSGKSSTLSATGASTYSWTSVGSGSMIVVTPAANPSTYTVIGLDSLTGCTSSSMINIGIFPGPIIQTVANPTAVCEGHLQQLLATGALTYTWYPGGIGSTIQHSPSVSTTFSVTGIAANGCSSSSTLQTIVNPLPLPSIAGSDIFCFGDQATFTATGADNYQWNGLANGTSFTLNAAQSGTISVFGTNSVTGCGQASIKNYTVEICNSLSKREGRTPVLNFYPNPCRGIVSTVVANDHGKLLIQNQLGQVVFEIMVYKGEQTFDISELSRGVYFIQYCGSIAKLIRE